MQKSLNKGSTVKRFFSTLVMTSLVVPGILLQVPEAKAAGTLANTVIGNQATAKYKDAGGNSYTSTSNLVTTTIASVYSVVVTPDGTNALPGQVQNASPGTIVYFPYTVTNTGNAPDSYSIATLAGTAQSGDGTVFTPVSGSEKVYLDVNGNGIIDVGDTQITTTTPSIPADSSIKLIMQYQVPTGATGNQVAYYDLQATSVGNTAVKDINNFSKTTVSTDAVVSVVKSVDKAAADPGSDLTYNFTINNTGNKAADNIILTDNIPVNTTFIGGTTSSGGTFRYFDGVNGTGTDITSSVTTAGTLYPNVKSIVYTLGDTDPLTAAGTLPASNSLTISFKVRVNAETAAGALTNVGKFSYKPDAGVTTTGSTGLNTTPADTNTVNTNVNKKAGALITFAAPADRFVTGGTVQTVSGTDGALNDTTVEDTAPAGTYVYYKNVITNNGNAPDTFNIGVDSSSFPTGATVTFLKLTDLTVPSNNTSPLLDTNTDGTVDTGLVQPGAGNAVTIVTRVFIPANATLVNTSPAFALTVRATSTNGGTSVGTGAGNTLTDTTTNTLQAVNSPKVVLANVVNGNAADGTNQTFTQSANGATVSYPLNVKNDSLSSDTYNLSPTSAGGFPITYYPIVLKTTATPTAINSTSVVLADVTGLVAGDKIVINGQTLTVASVTPGSGTTGNVTFAAGQSLATAIVGGAGGNNTVVKASTTSVTSTNLIAQGSSQDILAVVTIPVNTPATTTPLDIIFRATSTNNSSIYEEETDKLVIPSFKTFSLVANRTGSAPAGGVLFYDHTITNTGNTSETFNITVPSDVAGGMSYQLIKPGDVPSGQAINGVVLLNPGDTYNFKLKVTVPAGLPTATVDSKIITVHETSSPVATDLTNTDTTTVVSGFISLVKSVTVYPVGTGATGGTSTGLTTAKPGEILEYTINYTNIGTQSALESTIIDAIPANTTYIPNSLVIGTTSMSDAKEASPISTTDTADFNSVANAVTFNIGNNATSAIGGTVAQAVTGSVKFRVKVN